MQRKMISLLGAAGLMAMTTAAAVSRINGPQNNTPPPPRAGHGRAVAGQVSGVDVHAGTITVASRWDETQKVRVGPSVKIYARKDTTVAGLKVGDTLQVNGVFSQLTALSILAGDPPAGPPRPFAGGRRGGGGNNHGDPGAFRGGPNGFDGPGGPHGMGGPEDPGDIGGPEGPGVPRDMGGPGGPGGPRDMRGSGGHGGPGDMGGFGESDNGGGPRADASGADGPRVRGRRISPSVRAVSDDGPGQPERPADDLGQDSRPGPPNDSEDMGAPPPPPRPGEDDPMDGGPRGGMMGGAPRGGGGMMGGGPRDGGMMRGGPRGGFMMGAGPRPRGPMGGDARLSGKITSLSPLTIVVSDSLSLVIKTNAKTHVTKIVTESLADVQKGDRIVAAGAMTDDGLTAKSVAINLEP